MWTFYVFTLLLIFMDVTNSSVPKKEEVKKQSSNLDCNCIHHKRCKSNNSSDGYIDLIDIRMTSRCESYFDVCCSPGNIMPEKKENSQPFKQSGCGVRNENGVGFRIAGNTDNEANFAEFPWMVAILNTNNIYLCGGSLIHPSIVLTAAHCIKGKNITTLKARFGEWDLQTVHEIFTFQERNLRETVYHENYHAGSLSNDFALLRLEKPVDIMENVNVICLPNLKTQFDDDHCYVSGWGKNSYGKEGVYQAILKRIKVPLVSHDLCESIYQTIRKQPSYKLDETFICAGGENDKDACTGDGGSPLMCPTSHALDRYYQAGIVSWGLGCGKEGLPGVYANVPLARSWIDQKLSFWDITIEG